MRSVKELLLWAESGFGDKEAIIDVDRGIRWTYADLSAASRSICASYASGEVRKGDRVGWLTMAPGADVTALSIGARKMGAIPVTLNARAAPEQLAWMIGNVELKALSYTADTAELLTRLQEIGIPTVKHFVAIDEPIESNHHPLSAVYADHPGADEPGVEISPDDIALIVYTSGSTGRPKPVMHSEARWLETTMNVAYQWALTFDDRFLQILPPHFVGWAHGTCAAIRAGASQVCARFAPASLPHVITEERCTHMGLTPTMIRMLKEEVPRIPGFSADNDVRVVMLGGELATDEVLETTRRLFPKMHRVGSHGATEAVTLFTGVGNPRLDGDGRLLGKPLPGIIIELRDQETGELITEPEIPGEMYVDGPVAVGIWGDEKATAANFPGGWWRSGDIVVRDKEGYFRIAGRSDNVFKSGGIKIQCEEVESLLKCNPLILDAVVVPVPDTRFGLVPHAFVRHSEPLSIEDLDSWWRQRSDAPPYARPRHWTFWGDAPFPMVTAAKVDRQAFRRRAEQIHQKVST